MFLWKHPNLKRRWTLLLYPINIKMYDIFPSFREHQQLVTGYRKYLLIILLIYKMTQTKIPSSKYISTQYFDLNTLNKTSYRRVLFYKDMTIIDLHVLISFNKCYYYRYRTDLCTDIGGVAEQWLLSQLHNPRFIPEEGIGKIWEFLCMFSSCPWFLHVLRFHLTIQ